MAVSQRNSSHLKSLLKDYVTKIVTSVGRVSPKINDNNNDDDDDDDNDDDDDDDNSDNDVL